MANINLSGSVGSTGVAILGNADVTLSTDADYTLAVSEYTNKFLNIASGVSLTATRNIIAPLVKGQEFTVQNNTTGAQAIQIIGSSGTGVIINNGSIVSVVCDGTNYTQSSGSSSTSTQVTLQPGGTATGDIFTDWGSLVTKVNTAPAIVPCRIYFDATFGQPEIVSGAWSLPETLQEWTALLPAGGSSGVQLDDGATITPAEEMTFTDLNIFNQSTSASPVFIYGVDINQGTADFYRACFVASLADGVPLFTGSGSATLTINLHDTSILSSSGGPVIDGSNFRVVNINLFGGAVIQSGALINVSSINIAVFSAGALVDPSFYSQVSISGVFIDSSGTGVSTIPAANCTGSILSDTSANIAYISNGTVWNPITLFANTLIFKPGGVAGGNIFTDETALAAATQELHGAPYTIFFDLSLTSFTYSLQTVGVWNLANNGTWMSSGQGSSLQPSTIIFANNTQLPLYALVSIAGALTINITQSSSIISTGTSKISVTMSGSANLTSTAVSAGALWAVSSGGTLTLRLQNNASIADSSVKTITGQGGHGVSTIIVTAEDESYVGNGLQLAGNVTINAGPACSVNSSLYSKVKPANLYIDTTGTGVSTIPSNTSGLSLLSNSILYAANGSNWIPVSAQSGRTTLTNGVSPAISVPYLDSSSRIVCSFAAPNSSTTLGTLIAQESDRTNGAPGTFVITSLDPSALTTQTNDQSDIDWVITQDTA